MDRMFCYLWEETTNPNECKFGERWVKAGQDPETEVLKRIKQSLGVRKDLLKDGTVRLVHYWDVTELSQKVSRYYKGSRMDDYIRPEIGHRKGTTGEIHEISASEVKVKVNAYLHKVGQPLPVAGLSQNQFDAAVNVLEAVEQGKRTIVAELCARFGKTIWSGSLIRETNANLTIVCSYVLTSFASFKKDLSDFKQFADLVLVDTADDGYEKQIQTALADKKQVVAFLSMCNGGNRQKKIDFLFGVKLDRWPRLVLVDEADFGVHKANQSRPLIEARSADDVVVLMTGTNGDKAASIWPSHNMHYLSVTYPELLMEKHGDRLAA